MDWEAILKELQIEYALAFVGLGLEGNKDKLDGFEIAADILGKVLRKYLDKAKDND